MVTTRKKGRGRPRKGSGQAKSESVLLRMDPGERRGFTEAAILAGAPLAVWIRERLRRAAWEELQRAGKPVPFLNE